MDSHSHCVTTSDDFAIMKQWFDQLRSTFTVRQSNHNFLHVQTTEIETNFGFVAQFCYLNRIKEIMSLWQFVFALWHFSGSFQILVV